MRIDEVILNEQMVFSSWISDLDLQGDDIRMSLLSGNEYIVKGAGSLFDEWTGAMSKGKFWHRAVRGLYFVVRLR
jgi:hypothetical protein